MASFIATSQNAKTCCFLCNKTLEDEILLNCYFNDLSKEKKNQPLETLASKKAHFLCSLFFEELDLIIENGQVFLKGGQKIKTSHYLEECKVCSLDALGACLIKCGAQ